jgi:gliding motility-associated protein GldC
MLDNKVKKTSEIKIKVGLNEQNIPVDIKWKASDSEHERFNDCKSINLSIWDPVEKNSLGINLWTTDLMVDEMHSHYFRTLLNFTESYVRATKNPYAKELIQSLCTDLAKKTSDWEEGKEKEK